MLGITSPEVSHFFNLPVNSLKPLPAACLLLFTTEEKKVCFLSGEVTHIKELYLHYFLYACVRVCVWDCIHEDQWLQRPEVSNPFGAGVTGRSEPPQVGTGIRTQVL